MAQKPWGAYAPHFVVYEFGDIISHYRSHLDEIFAAFMLLYLNNGRIRLAKGVRFGFWPAGSKTPDGRSVSEWMMGQRYLSRGNWVPVAEGPTLVLGCGGEGPCNEHASASSERVAGQSCATLVADILGLTDDPRIAGLLRYTVRNDLNGEKGKDTTFSLARTIVDLHKINKSTSLTELNCEGQQRVMKIGINMCRALCRIDTKPKVDGRSLLGSIMAYWLMRNHSQWPDKVAKPDQTKAVKSLVSAKSDDQFMDWVKRGFIGVENGVEVAERVAKLLTVEKNGRDIPVRNVPTYKLLFNHLLKKVEEPYALTTIVAALYAMIGDNYTMSDFVSDVCEILKSKAFAQDEYLKALEIISVHAKSQMVDGVSKRFKLVSIDGKGNKTIGDNEALGQAARSDPTRAQVVVQRNTEGLVAISIDKNAWSDEGAAVRLEITAAIREAELRRKGLPLLAPDVMRREGPIAGVPHWFMFKGGAAMNGALTNPNETPTQIPLETIVQIVSEVLKKF